MLGTLIRRELHGHFTSLRFIVCMAATAVVVVGSVLVRIQAEESRWEEYRGAASARALFLDEYAHQNRLNPMIQPVMPPAELGALFEDSSDPVGFSTIYDDALGALFHPVDLIFIVAILLSLFAIILSYDAVSGERERGTLRVLLSYPIRRANVVLAKLLAGSVAIAVPFALALVLGLLVMLVTGALPSDVTGLAPIGMVAAAALLYVIGFSALGVAVSAFARSSATSVFVGLLTWALFVLLIPSVAPSLAERIHPVPSMNVIDAKLRELERNREDELRDIRVSLAEQGLSDEEVSQRFAREVDRVNGEHQNHARQIYEPYQGRVEDQVKLGWTLSSTSPYTNFVVLAASLAGTGIERTSRFRQQSSMYQTAFWEFAQPRIAQAQTAWPLDYQDRRLDLSGRPEFVFREASLRDRFGTWGMINLAILAAFTIVFFVAAAVQFQRYDAR